MTDLTGMRGDIINGTPLDQETGMKDAEPRLVRVRQLTYSFGEFTLDLSRGFLLRGSEEIQLRAKSFEALKYLVLNQGRLVSKSELMKELWPDAFVGGDSLAHCLMDIRKVLGEHQKFLRTVPRRGYVFESVPEVPQITGASPAWLSRTRAVAAVVAVALLAGAALLSRRMANLRWARESIPRVEALASQERFFEAYDLALKIFKYLPYEPALGPLVTRISFSLTVSTTPPGAHVYLSRFDAGRGPDRKLLGTTPLVDLSTARGDYILAIEKTGYEPFERTISSALGVLQQLQTAPNPRLTLKVDQTLIETSRALPRMVLVPGGEYRLVGWGKPTGAPVRLSEYWLDRFEVSNRDYKQFVDATGYGNAKMSTFRNHTGLPGPRNWTGGEFPEGKGDHPVTGINWYEAAAYCRFRGKRLPTVFEWEKAARNGVTVVYGMAVPWGLVRGAADKYRANFNTHGTTPVNSFAFGMSAFGCYNIAGNVAEWTANPHSDGFVTTGGGWDGPLYLFADYGKYPASYSSDTLGFRCACQSIGQNDQGAMTFASASTPAYTFSSVKDFRSLLRHYHYDKTPLNPEILEMEETPAWRRERIIFSGANEDRVVAFLYLPKSSKPPFQVLHYAPGYMPFLGFPVTDAVQRRLAPHIKYGRAAFLVALKGYAERPWPRSYQEPPHTSVRFRDQVVQWTTDIRRGVDYLETRSDIDASRIAFGNVSTAWDGLIFSAVEERYRSILLIAPGIDEHWKTWIPEANPVNFAPHIGRPKLMLAGRYDEAFSFKTQIEPLYRLLREPKRMTTYDGGHLPPLEVSVPTINAWLDETLGPVNTR